MSLESLDLVFFSLHHLAFLNAKNKFCVKTGATSCLCQSADSLCILPNNCKIINCRKKEPHYPYLLILAYCNIVAVCCTAYYFLRGNLKIIQVTLKNHLNSNQYFMCMYLLSVEQHCDRFHIGPDQSIGVHNH